MTRIYVLTVVVTMLAGCAPNAAGWRVTAGVLGARDAAAAGIAAGVDGKHRACLDHGARTKAYAECIRPHTKALSAWQRQARPAATSSIRVAVAALEVADAKRRKLGVKALLLPAACALARGAQDWGHYLPGKATSVLAALRGWDTTLCTAPSPAARSAGAWGSGLGAVGLLLQHVADALGTPLPELQAKVRAALAEPMRDATDDVAERISAAMPPKEAGR